MEYDANITVFDSTLHPTMNTYEGTKAQIESYIDTAISNAGSTFHNIQIIIMKKTEE